MAIDAFAEVFLGEASLATDYEVTNKTTISYGEPSRRVGFG